MCPNVLLMYISEQVCTFVLGLEAFNKKAYVNVHKCWGSLSSFWMSECAVSQIELAIIYNL